MVSSPARRTAPLSGEYTPVMTLISVDLPAPFSPIRAWTSPARRVKSTSWSARTPGNDLVTPETARTSVPGVAPSGGSVTCWLTR